MSVVTYACGVMLAVAILAALYRAATGPTVFDRMLAFDLVATCGVTLVALLSILWKTGIYLELILVYTLLGFLGATAMTLYLNKTAPPREPDSATEPHRPAPPSPTRTEDSPTEGGRHG